MNTNIAHKADGKWYVVTSQTIAGTVLWHAISRAFDTSAEARAAQVDYVMGRKAYT